MKQHPQEALSSPLAFVQEQLGKPYKDLEFLLVCLKELLLENGEEELANFIPWINGKHAYKPEEFSEKHIQLYSIIFQLLNIVEVNGAVQQRREAEDTHSIAAVAGLWGRNLKKLVEQGISPEEMLRQLPHTRVEPVLTAHPTEAKRATVLEQYRELYLLIVKRENQMFTSIEQDEIRREVKLALERLWRTGEVFTKKPDVSSEVRNVMHYLVNVFPEVLPVLDRRLAQAWEKTGLDPDMLAEASVYPQISFGNWVGGDRDGHPLVTQDVTKETLAKFRLNAFVVVRRSLFKLVKRLSFAYRYEQADIALQRRIDQLVTELGTRGEDAFRRNEGEVFRQYVGLIMAKLPLEVKRDHAVEMKEFPNSYRIASDLLSDLQLLQRALVKYGAKSVAYADVHETIRCVQTFGFHLANIDIRQNSAFHDKAIGQLMQAASIEGNFAEWSEEERLGFLNRELSFNRPFTHVKAKLDKEADAVLSCYRVVAEHVEKYSVHGIGSLIVSMTRSLSDLLSVYLLAREAGLTEPHQGGLVCLLPVVPLFETIEDLHAGPQILEAFLSHPITQRSLAHQQHLRGENAPVQQVMIGYSDSNKDGGILASQWGLYSGQSKMAEVGRKYGVKIRFFHGKGGSISRGAGPTHYFVAALPHSTINGDIRLTEQGETIAQKYANRINASYNLELLVANTFAASIAHQHSEQKPHVLEDVLSYMASESKNFYQKLITNPHFIPFFRQATPIDAIEMSKIGSRPSRRTGGQSLSDLRAIPWVFSWSQARYNITSWYGVGYVLERLMEERPEDFARFKAATKHDPLIKYVLTNVDTSLAATDSRIMKAYANLVAHQEAKEAILGLLLEELSRTRKMFNIVFDRDISERRKQHYHSNILRSTALDDLHFSQIALLKQWRHLRAHQFEKEAESVLGKVLLSINAIASAMRNTG